MGVFARRFGLDGIAQGSIFAVNAVTAGHQQLPEIATDDAGNFVICWEDRSTGTGQIHARAYRADGTPLSVGFMVSGIGGGTALAINGAVAHALNEVIFKGLLFMSMGAVLHMTGRINGSDLGGLYKTMPITTGLCIVGACSISACLMARATRSDALSEPSTTCCQRVTALRAAFRSTS